MATVGAKLSPIVSSPASHGLTNGTIPDIHVNAMLSARRAMLVVYDLLSIWGGALAAIILRFPLQDHASLKTHSAFLLLYSGLIILFCNTQKLYSGVYFRSSRQETVAVTRAVVLASLLLTAFIYASGMKRWLLISRFVVLLTMSLGWAAMAGSRYIRRKKLQNAPADGFICRNVLIVGTGVTAQALHQYLQQNRHLGYIPAGFISGEPHELHGPRNVLGSLHNLADIARAHFIDEAVICTDSRAWAKEAISKARRCGLGIRMIPDLYDGLAWGAPFEYIGQFPTMCLDQKQVPGLALMMKRALDVLCSSFGLILLLPVIFAVGLAVKLDSPGPIFYTSDRVGRKGRIFGCHKFRTMIRDAEQKREQLEHLNERDGILFKISNDPRITRVGRFLRKYSLDELPQLWNVIKGDMSLVGPRPPIAAEVRQYELDHLKRLDVMPGITGLWQVEARTNSSFASYIALDMEYVDHWNLSLDLRILLKTAAVVFAGTGR